MTDLPTAIQQASLWRVEAYPVVKALLLVEEARDKASGLSCVEHITECVSQLHHTLSAEREAALYRNMLPMPAYAGSESEWEAYEAFNEELNRSVPTVDQVIRDVERE